MGSKTTERLEAIRGRTNAEATMFEAWAGEHFPSVVDRLWLLTEHDRLTAEVDRLTVNAKAREGDALRASQREVERLRAELERTNQREETEAYRVQDYGGEATP